MLGVRAPTEAKVAAFLREHEVSKLSYAEVGATRDAELPAGYVIDRRKVVIGRGEAVFAKARKAIDGWEMHRGSGVTVAPLEAPREGLTVALVARAAGVFTTSACRVVYRIAEARRYGFAYGTLADHPVAGEERFVVEHEASEEVTFELCAFSRPNSLLFRLAKPIARRKQVAMGAGYVAALQRFVGS